MIANYSSYNMYSHNFSPFFFIYNFVGHKLWGGHQLDHTGKTWWFRAKNQAVELMLQRLWRCRWTEHRTWGKSTWRCIRATTNSLMLCPTCSALSPWVRFIYLLARLFHASLVMILKKTFLFVTILILLVIYIHGNSSIPTKLPILSRQIFYILYLYVYRKKLKFLVIIKFTKSNMFHMSHDHNHKCQVRISSYYLWLEHLQLNFIFHL